MNISTKQYTKALYDVAGDKIETILNELNDIKDSISTLKPLLLNPQTSDEEKFDVLHQSGLSLETANLLLILTGDRNLDKLSVIYDNLNKIYQEKNQVLEVEVISTDVLTEDQIKNLTASLEGKYHKKIILKTKINADILGGMIIRIGDEYLDCSILNKLNQIKASLSK